MKTSEILTNVKSLSRERRSCSYYRVDLHIHSPVSPDYLGNRDVSPYQFVSAFVERGFDLIAITDHNTGKYIDKAIEASNQIAIIVGKNIRIIPGVELYVSPGIHILAFLSEGGSAAISDLLSLLKLPVGHHGDTTKRIDQPIGEIARVVHERGGLLIGAHCNSTNGVVEELDGQTRLEWLRALDALEINAGSEEDKVLKTIEYVDSDLKVSIPFTFGSDSHDCMSDTSGMWVKMALPSLTSLRQLVFEPELRIRRNEPVIPEHGRIVGFTTTHGIYPEERFRFSPHLNVILGGRGAGKSAAIDLLRFAFEAEPQTSDGINEVFANRIMGFLQSVGEVLVVAVGTDNQTYAIIRSGEFEKLNARATPTFTANARVYQVSGDNLILRDMHPQDVLGVEFYGQGEAARLADRDKEQLRLIDENLNHSDAINAIAEAEHELATDESRLIECMEKVDKLRVEEATRQRLEERRDSLAESLADPIFSERSRWDRERTWVQGRIDWVKDLLDSQPESMPLRTDVSINIDESSARDVLDKIREASDRILKMGETNLGSFRKMLTEALSELQKYRSEWNDAFENADRIYRARLAQLGAANLNQAAAEQRSVEQELRRIETVIEPEIVKFESEMEALENRRAQLIARLSVARSTIANSRSKFVEELNSRLSGDVVVDFSSSDSSEYFEAIYVPLDGSGIQHREKQISQVCESFTPTQFVKIVRTSSIDQLTAIGITENNAKRVVENLTNDDLYKIERVDVPRLPSIRIKREGETKYTDLLSLSVGEKCSAILSIALLSKGKPLVIDQPEDDLDHAFIIDSIVEGIRTAKSDRQIIAATHNPNIPVLGDAEMVFRVVRRAGKDVCQIQNSGGLEIPQITEEVQSLEGGADAFERRRRRYSGVS